MENTIQELQNELQQKVIKGLSDKLDQIIINGLKLKGHVFEDVEDLKSFITNDCRIEDRENIQTFFALDVPFLEWHPSFDIDFDLHSENKVNASLGSYRYL